MHEPPDVVHHGRFTEHAGALVRGPFNHTQMDRPTDLEENMNNMSIPSLVVFLVCHLERTPGKEHSYCTCIGYSGFKRIIVSIRFNSRFQIVPFTWNRCIPVIWLHLEFT